MTSEPGPKPIPMVVEAQDPTNLLGTLKRIGGSTFDDWNHAIAKQIESALWFGNSDSEGVKRQLNMAYAGLIGISPADELQGMLAAQLIACHSASMECFRPAMIAEQTFVGPQENLSQANKLSRLMRPLLKR